MALLEPAAVFEARHSDRERFAVALADDWAMVGGGEALGSLLQAPVAVPHTYRFRPFAKRAEPRSKPVDAPLCAIADLFLIEVAEIRIIIGMRPSEPIVVTH